jgi:hypothetical protein
MASKFAPHWRCVPADAIVWREWDGELVVRNERSGSSHLLGPLAGGVLQVLLAADDGLSVAAIAAELGELPTGAADSEGYAAIEEVLAEFRRLELAQPVPQ